MKKTMRLMDLDCAHCAEKIQQAVGRLEGVTKVSVNFLTQRMTVEGEDQRMEDILSEIKTVVHKLDPDVTLKL